MKGGRDGKYRECVYVYVQENEEAGSGNLYRNNNGGFWMVKERVQFYF